MDYKLFPANDLARICGDSGDKEAWLEFVRRFQRPIALVVLRIARGWGVNSAAVVDDLVQEAFLRLCSEDCRLLKTFVPREPDSIIGYLKVIASNVTHDHFRAEGSQKRGGRLRRLENDEEDENLFPAPHQEGKAERAVLMGEIDQILESLVPDTLIERDRSIFWLYYCQGFSAREIAAIAATGLTVKGVESSIHRSTKLIRQAMEPPDG